MALSRRQTAAIGIVLLLGLGAGAALYPGDASSSPGLGECFTFYRIDAIALRDPAPGTVHQFSDVRTPLLRDFLNQRNPYDGYMDRIDTENKSAQRLVDLLNAANHTSDQATNVTYIRFNETVYRVSWAKDGVC